MDSLPAAATLLIVSVLSTVLGLILTLRTPVLGLMDRFMRTIGTAVTQLNDYHLDDDAQIRLSRRFALLVIRDLALLILALAGVIALAGAPFLLIDFSLYGIWELAGYIMGGVTAASLAYFVLFHKPAKKASSYPASKQLMYALVLGAPLVGKLSHRLNQLLIGKRPPPERGILVTGLARAGTTTLLQYLSRHPKLQSITYRHMPFLLGGHLWRKLNTAQSEKAERSHQDGILVDLDSPEAFEEYYWRIILKEAYYHNGGLMRHKLRPQHIEQYEDYLSNQIEPGRIYLSKNNNFILRAASFLEHRPQYVVALVFREPLSHAKSLLRQQQIQSKQQEEEPFILDYMNWLGHNEFGLGRMDFHLTGNRFRHHDKEHLDYWLERWLEYYRYALSLEHPNVLFVSNRSIATSPLATVNRVLTVLGLQLDAADFPVREPKPPMEGDYDEGLYAEAAELYEQLLAREGLHEAKVPAG